MRPFSAEFLLELRVLLVIAFDDEGASLRGEDGAVLFGDGPLPDFEAFEIVGLFDDSDQIGLFLLPLPGRYELDIIVGGSHLFLGSLDGDVPAVEDLGLLTGVEYAAGFRERFVGLWFELSCQFEEDELVFLGL